MKAISGQVWVGKGIRLREICRPLTLQCPQWSVLAKGKPFSLTSGRGSSLWAVPAVSQCHVSGKLGGSGVRSKPGIAVWDTGVLGGVLTPRGSPGLLFYLAFKTIIYLKESQRRDRSSILESLPKWPGASSRSPSWVHGLKHLGHLPLPSHSRKLDWKRSNQNTSWRPHEMLLRAEA